MSFFLFLISAYMLGCIAAIPAGPVQIEVVRRSINGHLKSSLMVVLGAFFVDVFYGAIAFFGIAPFLEVKRVMAIFWLAGGLILMVLGAMIIINGLRQQEITYNGKYLHKKRWGLIGGISLSVTNPVMVLWWLSGVRIFRDIGLITEFTFNVALTFLLVGSLGLASYLSVLALFLYWAKKFISPKKLRLINLSFGFFLLLISAYFIFTSVHNILKPG